MKLELKSRSIIICFKDMLRGKRFIEVNDKMSLENTVKVEIFALRN